MGNNQGSRRSIPQNNAIVADGPILKAPIVAFFSIGKSLERMISYEQP